MHKIVLLVTLLVSPFAFSQNSGAITGNVVDNEMLGEPLLFAHVQLKGDDKTTETNFNGNFIFENLATGAYTLVFSYAGYEDVEMPVVVETAAVTRINLGMSAKQFDLESVLQAEVTETVFESSRKDLPKK